MDLWIGPGIVFGEVLGGVLGLGEGLYWALAFVPEGISLSSDIPSALVNSGATHPR